MASQRHMCDRDGDDPQCGSGLPCHARQGKPRQRREPIGEGALGHTVYSCLASAAALRAGLASPSPVLWRPCAVFLPGQRSTRDRHLHPGVPDHLPHVLRPMDNRVATASWPASPGTVPRCLRLLPLVIYLVVGHLSRRVTRRTRAHAGMLHGAREATCACSARTSEWPGRRW